MSASARGASNALVFSCGTVCCVFFYCWPCSAVGLMRGCSVSAHACTTPIVSCARRWLHYNQLSGSLPSSLGSLTALLGLYVVVLSVSASARGATNALVFCCTVFCVFFLLLAMLLCLPVRCVAAQSLLKQASARSFRARAGALPATSCRGRCRARSGS